MGRRRLRHQGTVASRAAEAAASRDDDDLWGGLRKQLDLLLTPSHTGQHPASTVGRAPTSSRGGLSLSSPPRAPPPWHGAAAENPNRERESGSTWRENAVPPNAATTPGWRRRAPCSASVLRLLLPLPLLNRRRPAPSTPVGCLAARFALPSGARRRVSASQPAVAVCAPPHDSPAHGSVRPPSSSASSSTARSTPSLAGANRPRGYTTLLEVFLFCRTRPPSLSFAQHSDFADADPGDSRDGLCSLA